MTRLVFVSDTHLQHAFSVPDGDILVHCGDLTFSGTVPELSRAASWLNGIRVGGGFKDVVLIPGNHDWLFEKDTGLARSLFHPAITILVHEPAVIQGIKFFGSPWTPRFYDWAFNADRGPQLAALWSQIPDDTQLLVTHGPSMGRLDIVKRSDSGGWGEQYGDDFRYRVEHVGCADLRDRIKDLKQLHTHAYGHIHRPGVEKGADGVTYINASTCNESYKAVHPPHILDLA